ncbi:MAG: excisionase family DNA-binding protein [Rickettsiales bacterium]|jgi:excisionase family DNA binding protein|nr:excisionase family DNA-binding protein [Rickettsiales bacterium]
MDNQSAEKWADTEIIAKYLKINRQTVFALITNKNLPAVRFRNLWCFKLSEIDACLCSGGAND